MSSSNRVRVSYIKEASYGVTPAGVKALLVVQDITYTALKAGTQGNLISIEYLDTGTAGAEVVTVTGNKISVSMEDGVSTATQINAAIAGSAAALLLVTKAITGTASDTQVAAANTVLATGAGEFKHVRFIGEAYSGTPETTESQQIREDRMSSGQVVTGLTVGGNHNFELAKEAALEDYMESAMYASWTQMGLITRNVTLSVSGKTLTSVTGSFVTDGFVVGDFVKLAGFADSANNVVVMITSVATLILGISMPEGMIDAAGTGTTLQRGDKLAIGTTKHSLTIEKAFLDLTNKAINYRGMIAETMELNVEYGSLISGSFGFQGNDYEPADAASEFATYLKYITDAATTNTLNGSVDMPFLSTNVSGSYLTDAFCIQSLGLTLNNNLNAQNCIGNDAPEDYTPGTAQIEVKLSSYLKDSNWLLLASKLAQTPFALGFMVQNAGGWYGFYLPAVQVSFDDPAAAGANQDISMDMSGVAKVGSAGESALTIYRTAS